MAKPTKTPKKTASRVGAERAKQAMQSRGISAIRGLTHERLASALDQFDLGYLRTASQMWQKMKDRDDTIKSVAEKRELDAALLDWEILTLEDSPEANAHKEALEYAYNNLTATGSLDQNELGGVSKLIKQMMHAVGHRYAVHEIVWRPEVELTAEFRFTPLQFFENTTGKLRFLPSEGAALGEEMEAGGWMVTVGPGLMEASSINYLFKSLPLKAWLVFCDKAGMPGLHGETDAAIGSKEWDAFRDALAGFCEDWALITNRNAKINTIDLKSSGQLPHPLLVDRMDRGIVRLWRGADLGTMSQQGDATGSNPQQSETDILSAADALLVTETLQHNFDTQVIRYRFGTEPKAYFQLKVLKKVNHELELKIDDYLIKWGCGRGKKQLLAKYGRSEPDAGDELASAPISPAPQLPWQTPGAVLANSDRAGRRALFNANALAALDPAAREALAPVLSRLLQIEALPTPDAQLAALAAFKHDLPQLAKAVLAKIPALGDVLARIIGPAFADGLTKSTAKA